MTLLDDDRWLNFPVVQHNVERFVDSRAKGQLQTRLRNIKSLVTKKDTTVTRQFHLQHHSRYRLREVT